MDTFLISKRYNFWSVLHP